MGEPHNLFSCSESIEKSGSGERLFCLIFIVKFDIDVISVSGITCSDP